MEIDAFEHVRLTCDAQEKRKRSHELKFAENQKFVNSKFGAHFFNQNEDQKDEGEKDEDGNDDYKDEDPLLSFFKDLDTHKNDISKKTINN